MDSFIQINFIKFRWSSPIQFKHDKVFLSLKIFILANIADLDATFCRILFGPTHFVVNVHTGKCIRQFWCYLLALQVLHRPEVVDIGLNTL